MLWFKQITVVTFCVLTLLGCGFKPVYMANSSGQAMVQDFSNIYISNIPNRSGQYLRNQLIDRLYTKGIPQQPRYNLSVSPVKESISKLGIRKDATATHAQMSLKVDIVLKDKQTGNVLLERSIRSVNSFNILESQFTTAVTEQDARERALNEMSDTITTELSLYFKR